MRMSKIDFHSYLGFQITVCHAKKHGKLGRYIVCEKWFESLRDAKNFVDSKLKNLETLK